jgi:hypothetical protein
VGPQAWPHEPQLVALVSTLTQAALHRSSPVGQLLEQAPLTHDWPLSQSLLHAPQFEALVSTFTQAPAHSFSGAAQLPPVVPPPVGVPDVPVVLVGLTVPPLQPASETAVARISEPTRRDRAGKRMCILRPGAGASVRRNPPRFSRWPQVTSE